MISTDVFHFQSQNIIAKIKPHQDLRQAVLYDILKWPLDMVDLTSEWNNLYTPQN